ncbi:Uncharacterized protein EbC_38640 [Erwinia billingiae Eb661]|uniref:Fimbrial protein n=1 Tax=Erwinia billingiae (strain Eb661) TaxID=634500 RepID=D8MX38_ERWBE|nr:hypothetical protein [Erwinia billingiae]CAX61395.1 Uncharacterized protein EbC_38640 [Erwinia billingiae Eb661]
MKKFLKRKITFGLLTLTLSFNAAALDCYIGNVADEVVSIGKLVLLSGTGNGSRVWESKEYVRDITCKGDIQENVYFYPFPYISSETLPSGVEMGLVYDGKDLGTFDESSGNGNINTKIDTGWTINKTADTKTFRFKAYLKKTGDIDTSKVSGAIRLFQLDGKGGLNRAVGAKNYKFSLSEWNQAGTVSCSHTVSNSTFSLAVPTAQALSASSSLSAQPVVNIACTSDTSGLANLISTVTGDFSLSGNAMTNKSDHYGTDKDQFGYAVTLKGTAVTPGKTVPLTIPISAGKASYSVPLVLTPRLAALTLNSPAWIFNNAEKEVKAKATPAFTPLSVNTN